LYLTRIERREKQTTPSPIFFSSKPLVRHNIYTRICTPEHTIKKDCQPKYFSNEAMLPEINNDSGRFVNKNPN
jgi:hypothetical protein